MTRKLPISSKKYATPLTIELAQPIHPVSIALGVHALAALAVLKSSLPPGLIWAAIAIVVSSFYLVVFRLRYFHRVIWRGDGDWLLVARNGEQVIAHLAAESLASPFITLLNFESVPRAKRYSVVIFPTEVNADALRRLRVRLRVDAPHLE